MQITKPTKAEVTRELKDYIFITLGLISYALGWAAFLIPYQITTGGTTGIGTIIYYATGFPIQWSYFIINAVLILLPSRYSDRSSVSRLRLPSSDSLSSYGFFSCW